MRGLQIRCDMALAKVMAPIDPEQANWLVHDAEHSAFCLGTQDYHLESDQVPALFDGEPTLIASWKNGHLFSWQSAEMEACPNCNAGTGGDPCPFHG